MEDCVDVVVVVVVVADWEEVGAVVDVDVVVEVVGTEVSIETDAALIALTGPTTEAVSETEFAARRATTVPSLEQVTDTVIDDEVLAAEGVNTHPEAVPVFEKSPDAIPDTDSSNVKV